MAWRAVAALVLAVSWFEAHCQEDAVMLIQRSTEGHEVFPVVVMEEAGHPGEEGHEWQLVAQATGQDRIRQPVNAASGTVPGTELEAIREVQSPLPWWVENYNPVKCSSDDRQQITLAVRALAEGKSITDALCHTAVAGEECYKQTLWAMEEDFPARPEFYRAVRANASFEDFQLHLHTSGQSTCPKPCLQDAAQAVEAPMPEICMTDLTNDEGISFSQMEQCLRTLLQTSQSCSSCATEFLKTFVGKDIFHMRGVCLYQCLPMSTMCKFGSDAESSVQALTGDCLDKAASCLECVKPSTNKLFSCAGFPNNHELQRATETLIQYFWQHSIVYRQNLQEVIKMAFPH